MTFSARVVTAALTVLAVGVTLAPATASAATVAPTAVRTDNSGDRLTAAERAERSARVPTSRVGVFPSAYIGRYFDARFEAMRKCIVRRESNGRYGVTSANGRYRGAYQMNQGLANAAARKMGRGDLVGTSPAGWSRFLQDKAFWVIFNHGAGAGNWRGGRWSC